jgi:serine/threonine-protein kinase
MTPPTQIGRYEIKGELGRGGMATVYRGYDPSFEREVAIKVLPREFLHDPQFADRFKREIKTIAALEHPAIVPVYDVGEADGLPYFVMRYMTGGSLSNWIEKGKFSLKDAARIIERVASALAYAHKKGVIHRDLKPDNILFDANGEPFISDFGVAKFGEAVTNLTGSGVIGTPAYMSPEQAQGEKVDNRSDIYGLGVIIFQMLSGKQPYNADTPMGVVVKHLTEPVPEILKVSPDLPAETDVVIKTAMAKDRNDRYSTATHLSKALSHAALGGPGAATSASAEPSAKPARTGSGSRRGLLFGGLAVVVLGAVAAVVFGSGMLTPAPPPPTAAPPTQTKAPEPTAAAPTVAAPTEVVFAPACAAAVIAAPVAVENGRECVKKKPYTIIALSLGATFESLGTDPTMKCTPQSVNVDKQIIACLGPDLQSYDLKVCNPPATAAPASSAVGNCPAGQNFDGAQRCCAAPPARDAGCTIFRVNLRSCTQAQ